MRLAAAAASVRMRTQRSQLSTEVARKVNASPELMPSGYVRRLKAGNLNPLPLGGPRSREQKSAQPPSGRGGPAELVSSPFSFMLRLRSVVSSQRTFEISCCKISAKKKLFSAREISESHKAGTDQRNLLNYELIMNRSKTKIIA